MKLVTRLNALVNTPSSGFSDHISGNIREQREHPGTRGTRRNDLQHARKVRAHRARISEGYSGRFRGPAARKCARKVRAKRRENPPKVRRSFLAAYGVASTPSVTRFGNTREHAGTSGTPRNTRERMERKRRGEERRRENPLCISPLAGGNNHVSLPTGCARCAPRGVVAGPKKWTPGISRIRFRGVEGRGGPAGVIRGGARRCGLLTGGGRDGYPGAVRRDGPAA